MMNATTPALIGGLGTQEMMIILLIVVVLFGASRLPQLAKALGQSKRAFREGLDEADEEAARAQLKQGERVAVPPAELAAVDDEALFEEARRRAAAQRAEKPRT